MSNLSNICTILIPKILLQKSIAQGFVKYEIFIWYEYKLLMNRDGSEIKREDKAQNVADRH